MSCKSRLRENDGEWDLTKKRSATSLGDIDQPLDQGKESIIKNRKENPPGGEWAPPSQPLEQKLDKRKGAGKGAIIF